MQTWWQNRALYLHRWIDHAMVEYFWYSFRFQHPWCPGYLDLTQVDHLYCSQSPAWSWSLQISHPLQSRRFSLLQLCSGSGSKQTVQSSITWHLNILKFSCFYFELDFNVMENRSILQKERRRPYFEAQVTWEWHCLLTGQLESPH